MLESLVKPAYPNSASPLMWVTPSKVPFYLIAFSPAFFRVPGSHLLSHAVSSIVSSAASVLTNVFGMGTGVSPKRIATGKFEHLVKTSP